MRLKKKIALSLAVLLFVFAFQAALAQENLIVNPDVELVSAGQAEGWTRDMWYWDDGVSELSVVSGGYHGTYSLYVDNVSSNDARFQQTVAVEPDTIYKIACMIKAEGCDKNGAGATISIKDTFISTDPVYETGGAWTGAALYGMTGPDQTEMIVMARVGGYGNLSEGRAWFDAFEVVRLDAAPEGAHVFSLATIPPSANAGVTTEQEPGGPMDSAASTLIVGIAYALVCLALFLMALRGKLNGESQGSHARTLGIALGIALIARMIIAVMVRGYSVDMNCFEAWAARMAATGPSGFYSADVFCDYPPGYMYVLWLVGSAVKALGLPIDGQMSWLLIKMVPILMDMALALLIYYTARSSLGEKIAMLLGVLMAFNPASVVNSAAWGQVDSVLTVLLAVSMLAAARGNWYVSLPVFTVAVLVKPQALLLAPLGLVMVVIEVIESEEKGRQALRLLGAVALSAALFMLLSLPFLIALPGDMLPDALRFSAFGYRVEVALSGFMRNLVFLVQKYFSTAGSYSYITVNACNLYTLLDRNWAAMSLDPPTAYFAWIMMAVSYLYAFFLQIKAKDRGKIFLTASVLLALVYAVGPMMHERYLYPVLGLLLFAYAFDRDLRILVAFGVFSFTQFTNVALVLASENLIDAQQTLNAAVSLINVLGASFLAWTGWEMCVANRVVSLTRIYMPAVVQAKEKEKATSAIQESLIRPKDARLNLKRRDYVFMIALSLMYALVAFTNLGSMRAPQTQWKSSAAGEQLTFDLGQIDDFRMTYYGGISSSTFMVQFSEDGEVWSESHYAQYDSWKIFRWIWYWPCEKNDSGLYELEDGSYEQRARYVRITTERAGFVLGEVAFLDENGMTLPVASVYSVGGSAERNHDPKALIDEQDTVPAYPSQLNGMYFDEVYHGRTAYEHMAGQHAYEYTHPPLGKVLIMVGLELFGMTPFGWRFMPALFGVLMVPLMYLMTKQLFRRSSLSFFAAFLMASDCMHFTQSRLATIDVFAVFFIMLMYLFMIRYAMMSFFHTKLSRTLIPLGLCGISMGLAIACKWIGMYGAIGLAVIFFFTIIQRYREYLYAKRNLRTMDVDQRRIATRAVKQYSKSVMTTICFCLLFFLVVPALIYYFSYYLHLTPDGNFNLQGVWELQKEMFRYHRGIAVDAHSFASPWYEWPLIVKPMWYYSGSDYVAPNMVSSISCMGNPLVWWGGLIALIWVIARLASANRGDRRYLYIVIGFMSQYLPWVLVPRCTFIYHYFASVPFIILSTVAVFEFVRKKNQRAYSVSMTAYCSVAALLFIAFYPLMSGLPVWRSYAQNLRWFNWINF